MEHLILGAGLEYLEPRRLQPLLEGVHAKGAESDREKGRSRANPTKIRACSVLSGCIVFPLFL
jgi:hypothetical protein